MEIIGQKKQEVVQQDQNQKNIEINLRMTIIQMIQGKYSDGDEIINQAEKILNYVLNGKKE